MSINMRTLTQALAKTAAVIEKTVQTTVQEVTGPKPLQDYELLDQIGSGGPGLAWKLYSAKSRDSTRPQQYPTVCVWVLDKRALFDCHNNVKMVMLQPKLTCFRINNDKSLQCRMSTSESFLKRYVRKHDDKQLVSESLWLEEKQIKLLKGVEGFVVYKV